MIRSMTAFARQESTDTWGSLSVELRSVNHRYLDISLRLPEELRILETRMRESVQQRLSRGKVDISMRYQPEQTGTTEITLNEALVKQIASAADQVKESFYEMRPLTPIDVLRWPGVLQVPEVDPEVLHDAAMSLLDAALTDLVKAREREGNKLREIIEQRCDSIDKIVTEVSALLPEIKQLWKDKLLARLAELQAGLDESRIEQELAFMAAKVDIDEEIDRLTTHVAEVRRVLGQTKPVGRRLDFLMQELNREANTLGSKSSDARTGTASVDLKVFIEQMREQVQNIE